MTCPKCADKDKEIEQLKAELAELLSCKPPCSPGCYHHQTHPCEKCGRISGYLPTVRWLSEITRLKVELAEAKNSLRMSAMTIQGYTETVLKLDTERYETRKKIEQLQANLAESLGLIAFKDKEILRLETERRRLANELDKIKAEKHKMLEYIQDISRIGE